MRADAREGRARGRRIGEIDAAHDQIPRRVGVRGLGPFQGTFDWKTEKERIKVPPQAREAIMAIDGVTYCDVDVVWDPPWHPGRMTEDARLALNMF